MFWSQILLRQLTPEIDLHSSYVENFIPLHPSRPAFVSTDNRHAASRSRTDQGRHPSRLAHCWFRRRSANLSPYDTAEKRSCESDFPTTHCPFRRKTFPCLPWRH